MQREAVRQIFVTSLIVILATQSALAQCSCEKNRAVYREDPLVYPGD
jgi:hypothetical protein